MDDGELFMMGDVQLALEFRQLWTARRHQMIINGDAIARDGETLDLILCLALLRDKRGMS